MYIVYGVWANSTADWLVPKTTTENVKFAATLEWGSRKEEEKKKHRHEWRNDAQRRMKNAIQR